MSAAAGRRHRRRNTAVTPQRGLAARVVVA